MNDKLATPSAPTLRMNELETFKALERLNAPATMAEVSVLKPKGYENDDDWERYYTYSLLPSLAAIELFATAVNMGVYSYAVTVRASRERLIGIWESWDTQHVLKHHEDQPNTFTEYKALVERMKKEGE